MYTWFVDNIYIGVNILNQTLDSIKSRFSCRSFTGEMPADEKIQAIAQAAIQSPSAMNKQRWQVIVVRNQELIAEMEAEGMRVMSAMPDKTMYERIQSRGGQAVLQCALHHLRAY